MTLFDGGFYFLYKLLLDLGNVNRLDFTAECPGGLGGLPFSLSHDLSITQETPIDDAKPTWPAIPPPPLALLKRQRRSHCTCSSRWMANNQPIANDNLIITLESRHTFSSPSTPPRREREIIDYAPIRRININHFGTHRVAINPRAMASYDGE